MKSLFKLILMVAVASYVFTACKDDDFTEEDLLNLQIDSKEKADSLNNNEQLVTYTVNVLSASVTQSANVNTRTEETSVAAGATVVITKNDSSTTYTTDANGRVVITDMPSGNVSLVVSATDHTTCYLTVNLFSNTDNASTNVYLFPTTATGGAATIKGVAYAETDFTNNAPEFAAGATVSAYIDVDNDEFRDAYWRGQQTSGQIEEIAYVSAVTTATVGADGTYSLVVPAGFATEDGIPITVKFDEYEADQTIVFEGASTTFGGIFGNGSTTVVPSDFGYSVAADLSTPGNGVAFTFEPQGAGMFDVAVFARGSGYPGPNAPATADTTYTINAVDIAAADTSTLVDFDTAKVTVTINQAGQVVNAAIANAGAGYKVAPTFNVAAELGSGSGAVIGVGFSQSYKAILTNGGSGYLFLPSIKYRVERYETRFKTSGNVDQIFLDNGTYAFEVSGGSIVLPNPGTNYNGSFTITNAVSEPEFVAEIPFERIPAEFELDIVDGVITGANIVPGSAGQGYNYASFPNLTVSAVVGAGTGANIIIDAIDPSDGSITAIQVINGGSGYQEFANNPGSASGAGTLPSFFVAPGKTYNVDYNYGTGFRREQEEASL